MNSIPIAEPRGRRAASPIDSLRASLQMLEVHKEMEQRMERSFVHIVQGARAAGLSWEQIGAALEEPLTTVRTRYMKATTPAVGAGRP